MWTLINNHIGRKTKKGLNVPNYFNDNDFIYDNFKDIAEGFNNFFTTIGTNLQQKLPKTTKNIKDYLGVPCPFIFNFTLVDEYDILKACDKLKAKTSQGLDILSNKLIKILFPKITSVIKKLINLSLTNGSVPKQLKNARVITIYKDGSKSSFNNYRPISLISAFGKFLEKIVCIQLLNHFNVHNLFYKNQFGFRAGYDTTHPLLHFTNNIKHSLRTDSNMYNLSVFIGLKKAFDTVSYKLLLIKLEHYGVKNYELKWFESYLTNRTHAVDIEGTISSTKPVVMGVPQGSILGPILFLIFINDFNKCLEENITSLLFADDTTLQTSSNNLTLLYNKMNYNLHLAELWFNTNLLSLNTKKTKYMLFYNKNHHIHFNNLNFAGDPIERIGEDCQTKFFLNS